MSQMGFFDADKGLSMLSLKGDPLKKHGRSFFGYKNHVNADARHRLIRGYEVSDASVNDSQKLDDLLNKGNTCAEVYGDGA